MEPCAMIVPCPTDILDAPPLEVVVAATFATDSLAEPLRIWTEAVVGAVKTKFTWVGFGNTIESLLQTDSALNTNTNGVNVILARLTDLEGDVLLGAPESPAQEGNCSGLESAVKVLAEAIRSSCKICSAPLVLILPPCATRTLQSDTHPDEAHAQLSKALAGLRNLQILGASELQEGYQCLGDNYYCQFLDFVARTPYSASMFSVLAGVIMRQVARARVPLRKVLVLDCDGTLWGGAVAELGPGGVELSAPFLAAQKFYLGLQQRGLLLCLCSRNVEADVRAVFEARASEMPLHLKHIVGLRVNWLPKSRNVLSLAEDLCLGLDTFIFVDDNPVECSDVQRNCPGVAVLHIPTEAGRIPAHLQNAWCLDVSLGAYATTGRTWEDEQRSELYRALLVRRQKQSSAASEDAFLASLNLKVLVKPVEASTIERAAQLTQRTNQHNIHKSVLSPIQVRELADATLEFLVVESSDRFGHHGIVGLMACDSGTERLRCSLSHPPSADQPWADGLEIVPCPPPGGFLHLRVWLLSCRALHLGIEYHMLRHVASMAVERDVQWLAFDWVLAERNEPAAAFLFSLPGGRFLPCARAAPSPRSPPGRSPVEAPGAGDRSRGRLGLGEPGPRSREPRGADAAELRTPAPDEVADRIEAALAAARDEGRPLVAADLPPEDELSELSEELRRAICRRLLPTAGRLQHPDRGQASAVQVLRGVVAAERCLYDTRGQSCSLAACPFRHKRHFTADDLPETGPREFGDVSVYRRQPRPPSGVLFVPVASALAARVSLGRGQGSGSGEAVDGAAASAQDGRSTRPASQSSTGTALHNDTYNFLARTLGGSMEERRALHQWVASQQRTPQASSLYVEAWRRICEGDAQGLGPEAEQQAARLKREIRHAQHLMLQDSNPDSYYRNVEHRMS